MRFSVNLNHAHRCRPSFAGRCPLHKFLQTKALTGYDNDSGMTMLRIGCMNLMLHGIDSPNFRYTDTLSKGFDEERLYDVVLANPPFKGAIDAADVSPSLPAKCAFAIWSGRIRFIPVQCVPMCVMHLVK